MAKTEPNIKLRRRAIEFAENLAAIASTAPDDYSKSAVYKAVQAIRKQYGFSFNVKRRMILSLVRSGASSYADLVRETHFAVDDIYKVVRDLESDRLVKFERIIVSSNGRGRPSLLIFAIEET